jgi:hypothetical protein
MILHQAASQYRPQKFRLKMSCTSMIDLLDRKVRHLQQKMPKATQLTLKKVATPSKV